MKIKGIFLVTLMGVLTHYVFTDKVTDAINTFTIKLYKKISDSEGENNVITSPISAQIALALLSLGSGGSTTNIMNSALNFPNSAFVLNKFALALKLLGSVNVPLYIANKIYVKAGYLLTSSFEKYVTLGIYSELQSIDFTNSDKAASIINTWVEDETHHKITNIVQPSMFNSETSVVLVNAIYFKGFWEFQFDRNLTKEDDFTKSSGEVIKVDFMNQYNEFNYARIDSLDAAVLEIDFKDDLASMVILLPNEVDGIKELETKLASTNLETDVFNVLKPTNISISIPKFTIETEIDLKNILPKIGLQSIFSPGADFSNLVEGENIFVSDAIQKAFIEVNEEGVKAAAATVIVGFGASLSLSFDANHPFIFILKIYTGDIFFIGKYIGDSGIGPLKEITRRTSIPPWWYRYPRRYPHYWRY